MADTAFETRTVTAEFEFRDDTDAPTLTGHAATFNTPYQVGYFREQIHPSAFDRTLKNGADVRLLVDHEGQPLARTKSGTLQLGTDSKGLTVRAQLDPTDPDVQRLIPKMRRGDVDQMSFAFRVPTDGDTWDHKSDPPNRTVREAVLHGGDVSVVTYPANEKADAQIRARDDREAAFVLCDAMLREIRTGAQFDEPNMTLLMKALGDLGVDLRATDEPYGDVDYADPGYQKDGKKRYPLDTEEHVRAAWSYINQQDNQTPYTAAQVASIMSRIKAAAPKFNIKIADANSVLPAEAVAILKEIDEMRSHAA